VLVFISGLTIGLMMLVVYGSILDGQITSGSQGQGTGSATSNLADIAGFEDAQIIGQYIAVSSSTDQARAVNLRLAAEAINGIVVEPGADFSFNQTVGDVANDQRYQIAPAVFEGEIVSERGGGICQVSTVLYIAALHAKLRIVERHPHTTNVDYVAIGLDATVAYSVKDLVITNNRESPILITASAEGQSVKVEILGQPSEDGVSVKVVSKLITFHGAGTPLPDDVEWDEDLLNSSFYIVESYQEIYNHGTKVDTIFLARDIYLILNESNPSMPDGNLEATK